MVSQSFGAEDPCVGRQLGNQGQAVAGRLGLGWTRHIEVPLPMAPRDRMSEAPRNMQDKRRAKSSGRVDQAQVPFRAEGHFGGRINDRRCSGGCQDGNGAQTEPGSFGTSGKLRRICSGAAVLAPIARLRTRAVQVSWL